MTAPLCPAACAERERLGVEQLDAVLRRHGQASPSGDQGAPGRRPASAPTATSAGSARATRSSEPPSTFAHDDHPRPVRGEGDRDAVQLGGPSLRMARVEHQPRVEVVGLLPADLPVRPHPEQVVKRILSGQASRRRPSRARVEGEDVAVGVDEVAAVAASAPPIGRREARGRPFHLPGARPLHLARPGVQPRCPAPRRARSRAPPARPGWRDVCRPDLVRACRGPRAAARLGVHRPQARLVLAEEHGAPVRADRDAQEPVGPRIRCTTLG